MREVLPTPLEPSMTRERSLGLLVESPSPASSAWVLMEMARSQIPTSLGIAASGNKQYLH